MDLAGTNKEALRRSEQRTSYNLQLKLAQLTTYNLSSITWNLTLANNKFHYSFLPTLVLVAKALLG